MTMWNPALPANSSLLRLSAGYIRGNEAAVATVVSGNNLLAGTPYFPTGGPAPIWFYSDTAPTGWTAAAIGGDTLLAIKGGGSVYNTTGGTTNIGTWVGPNYSLVTTDLPISNTGTGLFATVEPVSETFRSSGNPHHHDWTTTRPLASIGILCWKNA